MPEKENGYPSPHSFGATLPAYGFYIRHVKNITINDVQLNQIHKDERYPVVIDDVHFAYFNDIYLKAANGDTKVIAADQLKTTASTEVFIDHKSIK